MINNIYNVYNDFFLIFFIKKKKKKRKIIKNKYLIK